MTYITTLGRDYYGISSGAATYDLWGRWDDNTNLDGFYKRFYTSNGGFANYGNNPTEPESGTFNYLSASGGLYYALFPPDANGCWYYASASGAGSGDTITFKSNSIAPTAGTPSSSSVAATSATLYCTYYPNTLNSTAQVHLEYKKTSDSTWIQAGAYNYAQAGYGIADITRAITGLTGLTQYQFRLQMIRTTVDNTTLTSTISSFTTEADAPSATTEAATVVTAAGAKLNATIDSNTISTSYTFQWGPAGNHTQFETTPPTVLATDGSTTISADIAGLSQLTQYFFRVKAVYAGGTVYGSELNFTTAANPFADAAKEDHMQVFEFNERKYGFAADMFIAVASPAATTSDRFYNSTTPFVAGDVKVSIDGGTFNNIISLPSRVGTSPIFQLSLTAAEMSGTTIVVALVDQDGPAFRDAMVVIRTKQIVSQLLVDASTLTNSSAIVATGVGSGHGIEAVGGATGQDINGIIGEMILATGLAQAGGASSITLATTASATADYYNGAIVKIVAGTGVGQSRVIVDYSTGREATVNRSWTANPNTSSVYIVEAGPDVWNISTEAELSAIPNSSTGSYGQRLQAVYQRFFLKRTQTTTTQTIFKADSSTPLGTATVADDGATQTSGKIS